MSQENVVEGDLFPFPRLDALQPPASYQSARQAGPAVKVRLWNGKSAWLFTHWDDVRMILSDPRFSADVDTPGYPTTSAAREAEVRVRKAFINMDPPEHTVYRRMLTGSFMLKKIARHAPEISLLVDRLFDKMQAAGPELDFIEHFAKILPADVVSTVLGVPFEDFERLGKLSELRNDHTASPDAIRSAAGEVVDHLSAIIERKMKHHDGREDILNTLIDEQINPGKLPLEEAARLGAFLYIAGHETTTSQIGLGTLAFLINDAERRQLQNNSDLAPKAVEEMLRYNTLTHLNSARAAREDVEVSGVQIRAGESVFALLASANRDPEKFNDPEKFDISREQCPHMAFSFGVHQCLGQPLARLELKIVFERLFKRFPNMELAIPYEDVQFVAATQALRLASLPVRICRFW